jgi:LuxR family maltose regulon positive regulatory protein
VPRGIAEHLLGRMHAADATLREATATSLALGNRTTAVLAMNLRAGGMIRSGRLREAEAICLRIIQLAEETGGVLLSDIYAMLSELHYERNDLVAARLAAEKAIALGEQWVTVDGQIDGALRLAMVLQAQGQPAAAHQMMRRAEDWLQQSLAADSGFPWMPHLVAGMSARLALRQGRLDDVRQWVAAAAQAEDAAPPTLINHYHEFEALAKARLFLLQGDLPQAATLLAQLRPRAEAEERLESLIEIDIVQSLVAQAQGDTDRALDLLAQAVTIGFPAGYVRRFVDEGAPLRALLARLRDGQRRGSALRRACEALLAAFDPAAEAGIPVHAGDQLVEPLSEREREVLRLLAQGRSNQEIARQMVVATSTVKTHLHHIFAKLQTPDRLHAVTRARELGLLG